MQDATETFIDMLQEDNHSADKERPMRYIYTNEATRSYIEFEVEGIKSSMHPNIALDVFFHKLTEKEYQLPPSLLKSLKESDLDLILEAQTSSEALEELEKFIYVQSSQNRYTDEEGVVWEISSRSKREVNLEHYVGDGEYILCTLSSDDFITTQGLAYGSMGEKR